LTVQPGVTFQRVHDFLREQKSPFFATVTGGPPDGSLIGNVLERGEGSGPYGDRASHVCGLEVVLPTGELVRTGFGRFPGAATARLSPFGVGPHLDGLFIQSNLGIVTELTVFLHPRPKYLARFSMAVNDTAALAEVVDAIQPLVLRGVIASHSFGMWSAYKVMAINGRYPWEAMKGKTPLRLREISGKEPWNTGGALYAASARQRTAGLKLIQAAVKDLPCSFGFQLANGQSDDSDAWLGQPTPQNLRALYWRKKRGPPGFIGSFDPHRDRCGILWLHPTLPFVGAHIAKAVEIMQDTTYEHGFEPLMGMSCPSGRLANVYLAVVYDREIEGEDARAMDCHDAVMERLIEAGYPPYRLGVQSMRSVPDSGSPYEDVLARLKAALDPNDILSPGRYDFRRTGPRASA
jgi:4-cresol dehydrogenase (hydroxylating)